MIPSRLQKLLSLLTSCILVCANGLIDASAQQSTGTGSYNDQGAPLTTQDLQALVAPIALYPDALVAQVLAASTFTDQIPAAEDWLQQNQALTGQALMQAVNEQSWDPSVKAL